MAISPLFMGVGEGSPRTCVALKGQFLKSKEGADNETKRAAIFGTP